MAAGTARQLAWLARQLGKAPAVKEAFLEGRIGLGRARVLVQLTELSRLEGELAEAWLGRAEEVTVRRLGDEVRDVLLEAQMAPGSGLEPPPPAAPLGRSTSAQRKSLLKDTCSSPPAAPLVDRVSFSAEWSFVAVWREAVARCRRLERELGDGVMIWPGERLGGAGAVSEPAGRYACVSLAQAGAA